ncbi:o-succinylbenzoate--CoA ligase [Metabacillus herbersteinensis]|uniref:2-succinylbenzoate--CoA ligase n=1 Tax=Metabacillus herbersteinensis TaxID=283816 RepID=A0ABV6GJY8_9BACI
MNVQQIPNWLKQRAYLTPDRPAIKSNGVWVTFQELHQRVLHRANQLATLGVKKEDRVGLLMKNSFDMVIMVHALMYSGAVNVLLNNRLTSSELMWQIRDVSASYIFCDDSLEGEIHKLEAIDVVTHSELLSTIAADTCTIVQEFASDSVATIMYTSGTTGHPKGVLQTYGNHLWSAMGSALNLGLHSDDRWLATVPLFHISGFSILMKNVIYGMGIVLHEKFEAKQANRAITEDKVTIVSVVTTMLNQMLSELGSSSYPEHFRCMLLGGGPAPKTILEQCRDKKIPVFQTYGMTETSSQIVTLSADYSLEKLGSAGKPLFPCQLSIKKDQKLSAAFEEGEIVVKGPNVTIGYWNRNDATLESIKDSWLYTGDLGYLDDEGFLYVLDRRSDLIISGGENVYPAEIEGILMSHPAVTEAGVVGITDDRWGQVPFAFVVANKSISEGELLDFCKGKLATYKVPKAIKFEKVLPRNASNKLLRRKLKELIEEGHHND